MTDMVCLSVMEYKVSSGTVSGCKCFYLKQARSTDACGLCGKNVEKVVLKENTSMKDLHYRQQKYLSSLFQLLINKLEYPYNICNSWPTSLSKGKEHSVFSYQSSSHK